MNELVERLSQRDNRVEVRLRPQTDVTSFKQSIDRGRVHIFLPETRGGTELGVRLNRDRTDYQQR